MENAGSHKEWNERWKNNPNLGRVYDLSVLYTEKNPKNIYEFWQRAYFADLNHYIVKNDFNSFLELGSGRGTTSMYLAKNGYERITLVDLSENAFELAKRNFLKFNLPLPKMVLADVISTPFQSAEFDCIYNIGLLEHFEKPELVLKESFRILKPGGMIFMPIVPVMPFRNSIICRLFFNSRSLFRVIWIKLFGKSFIKKNKVNVQQSTMVRTDFMENDYVKFAEKSGFRNIKCFPYNPYWKVNKNGWFETNITLNFYKLHYGIMRLFKKSPILKTSSKNSLCLLLIAYK